MLAELVKAGKLPPVEQRLPDRTDGAQAAARDRPLRRHLAARLHRPADGENGNRINSTDKLLFWDATGSKITPGSPRAGR